MRSVFEFWLEVGSEPQPVTAAWESFLPGHLEGVEVRNVVDGHVTGWAIKASCVIDSEKKEFQRIFVVRQAREEIPTSARTFVGGAQLSNGTTCYVFELAPYGDRPPRPAESVAKKEGDLL